MYWVAKICGASVSTNSRGPTAWSNPCPVIANGAPPVSAAPFLPVVVFSAAVTCGTPAYVTGTPGDWPARERTENGTVAGSTLSGSAGAAICISVPVRYA